MFTNLLILSAIAENILYINKPCNSIYGYITFDYNSTKSLAWHKMEYSSYNSGMYKINIPNMISINSNCNNLYYKVNYVYQNYSVSSQWQSSVYQCMANNNSVNKEHDKIEFWILLSNSWVCLILYILAIYYLIKKINLRNKALCEVELRSGRC